MAWMSRLGQAAKPSLLSRLGAVPRSYSASAALQVDYGYDTVEEEELGEGWVPGRGVQWVVMGDSGPKIKRHVYADKLSKLLEVPLISMGSLLRQELHPRSSLYHKISNAINDEKLVPEDVIFGLLSKRLEEGYERGESGFILDGIPRTRIQAEILDEVADIDLVVNLKCPEEHLVRRDSIGVVNSSSCVTGSSAWKEKLHVYAEQGKELEEYYRRQKKLVDFQVAANAPGETWQGLLGALRLKHASALKSTQKLVA